MAVDKRKGMHEDPSRIEDFLRRTREGAFRPISTGIEAIDTAIGGGLFPQTVVLLSAAPGMGKTALASQICENIAKTGEEDVLYFGLDMSVTQLLARSIARMSRQKGHDAIGVSEILYGHPWPEDIRKVVLEVTAEYKKTIDPHIVYDAGGSSTDLNGILKRIQEEKVRLGHAPIVCIDFLQLLTSCTVDGREEDRTCTIKRAMQKLKEYAIKEDTVVIIVTANERAGLSTGDGDLISGRDLSDIEDKADLHLKLVHTVIAEGTKTVKDIQKIRRLYWQDTENKMAADDYEAFCTRFSLKVSKNRYGAEGREVCLIFDGAHALFTPAPIVRPKIPRKAGRGL